MWERRVYRNSLKSQWATNILDLFSMVKWEYNYYYFKDIFQVWDSAILLEKSLGLKEKGMQGQWAEELGKAASWKTRGGEIRGALAALSWRGSLGAKEGCAYRAATGRTENAFINLTLPLVIPGLSNSFNLFDSSKRWKQWS